MPTLVYSSPLASATYPTIQKFDSRAVRIEKTWSTQPRPYVNPLPFFYLKRVGIGAHASYSNAYCEQYALGNSTFDGDPMAEATNLALDRLRDKLGDQAQLAASIAEYRESFDMIADRAVQLYRVVKHVRKGNFSQAERILRINTKRISKRDPTFRPKESVKDSGQAWLEYWLGWSPLIGDISSAIRIVTGGSSPSGRIVGSGRAQGTQNHSYTYPWARMDWSSTVTCRCRVQAQITVADANRALAQQLGLTDALSTAGELIPFSFIVYWFVNIDAYLGQFSWWDGYSITGAHQTRSWEGTDVFEEYNPSTDFYHPHRATRVFVVQRSLGLPSVKLRAALPGRLSLSRAATAVSLLVQQFR